MTSRLRLLSLVVCVVSLRTFSRAAELSEGVRGAAPIAPVAIIGPDLTAPLGAQNPASLAALPSSLSLDEARVLAPSAAAPAPQTAATRRAAAAAAKPGALPQTIRADADVRGQTLLMVGTRS